MIHVEIDVSIRRPMDEVFERITNIAGYNYWMPRGGLFRESRQTSDGPAVRGTTFVDTIRHGRADGEIVDLEKPSRVEFRQTVRVLGVNVLESRPAYTLEEREGVTRVHHVAEGRGIGVFKLLEPVFRQVARAERTRTVKALKRSLESGS